MNFPVAFEKSKAGLLFIPCDILRASRASPRPSLTFALGKAAHVKALFPVAPFC